MLDILSALDEKFNTVAPIREGFILNSCVEPYEQVFVDGNCDAFFHITNTYSVLLKSIAIVHSSVERMRKDDYNYILSKIYTKNKILKKRSQGMTVASHINCGDRKRGGEECENDGTSKPA